jgi:hypothetical protein
VVEPNDLSLYEELSSRGFEAAIVATYNASFGFYERVLLRRLQAVGCRAHLLLTDARQCSRAFATEEDLPEHAGAEYGLLPVRAAGAFHPKFVLLLGPKRARLIIGSHNVTLCGFGLNREVTSLFDIEAAKPSAGLARQIWRFVEAWTSDQAEAARNVRDAILQIAPWLQGASDTDAAGDVLLWTGRGRASLWEQLRPFLVRPITRVSAVSPYFDADFGFLSQVVRDFGTAAVLVAVEPTYSECPSDAPHRLADARFLDVSSLGPGWDKRLHAKIFRFEFEEGGSVVVTGSANASRSAWLTANGGGNAEMVVVHVDGDDMWHDLGLAGFADLPEVGIDVWQALKVRKDASVEESSGRAAALFHAVVVPEGFEVDAEFIPQGAMSRVEALAGHVVLGDLSSLQRAAVGRVVLRSDDPTVLDAATLLRVSLGGGACRYAIVTRVDELRGKAAGSAQQKFRMALSGLQGDPEQLANLFRLIQKALFEQEPLLQAASPSASHASSAAADENEVEGPEPVLTSLKMSPAELIKQRHHRRVAPSSEIASIIDALIYQLGIRSATEAPPPPVPESEEPEAPPEPEKHGDGPKEPTGAERAAQCRSKVNTLFSRMTTQLEAVESVGRNVTVAIVQLAAVLGIVKYLRLGVVDWLPKNDRLVDAAKARNFFNKVCRSLYGPTRDLAGRAIVENNGQPFDELTSVRALLVWLALDSGVNAETLPRDLKDAPENASALVLGVACLLPVAAECAQDSHAGALLAHTLAEQPSEAARAERHLTWARRVHAAVLTSKTPASGPFKLGDIVVPFKAKSPKPFVVSQVLHGKTGVLDLDGLTHKQFADGWLAPIELPPLSTSVGPAQDRVLE